MADAQSIILHHFKQSPFAEKVRLALRMKNLGWHSVKIPVIAPKPDLTPLTGGYRRTPVMQIGADIFCDTSIMLTELERRFQIPALNLPGHEGLEKMVAAWTNNKWFHTSVGVIFGTLGDKLPREFIDDRSKLFGREMDLEKMRTAVPALRDQWRSQLMWIEERLEGGRGAGGGHWIIGTKPGMVDAHAYFNPWFMELNMPDFLATCFDSAPRTQSWYERMKEIRGPEPEELSSTDALTIAREAAPRLKPASTAKDLQNLTPGDRVAIAPDDYGKDWVEGDLVVANAKRVIIAREDEVVENVHVHFPRVGYILRRA